MSAASPTTRTEALLTQRELQVIRAAASYIRGRVAEGPVGPHRDFKFKWEIISEETSQWLRLKAHAAEAYPSGARFPVEVCIWRTSLEAFLVRPDGAVSDDPLDLSVGGEG